MQTFGKISLIKKDQRLGNTTAGAGQTGQHLKYAKRLRLLYIAMIENMDQIRNKQGEPRNEYGEPLFLLPLNYIIC